MIYAAPGVLKSTLRDSITDKGKDQDNDDTLNKTNHSLGDKNDSKDSSAAS